MCTLWDPISFTIKVKITEQFYCHHSLKIPKIKKILLYEMKFLVPNYSLHLYCKGKVIPLQARCGPEGG